MLDKSAAVVCSTRRNRRNKPDAIHTGMPKGECCAKNIKTQRGKNTESALLSIDHQEEVTHQTAHYANYPLDTEPIGTAEQRLQLQLRLTRQGSVRSAYRSLSAWSAYSVYHVETQLVLLNPCQHDRLMLCLVVILFVQREKARRR